MSDLVPSEGVYLSQDTPMGAALVELKLSTAATLADIAKDFTLFHHLSIYSWMGIAQDADPVQFYVNETPNPPEIFHLQFNQPVFSYSGSPGTPTSELDFTLFGVEHKYWPALRKYIAKSGIMFAEFNIYFRVAWELCNVLDSMAVDKMITQPDVAPLVPCYVLLGDGYPFSQNIRMDNAKPFPLKYVTQFYKTEASPHAKEHLEQMKLGVNPLEDICPINPTNFTS